MESGPSFKFPAEPARANPCNKNTVAGLYNIFFRLSSVNGTELASVGPSSSAFSDFINFVSTGGVAASVSSSVESSYRSLVSRRDFVEEPQTRWALKKGAADAELVLEHMSVLSGTIHTRFPKAWSVPPDRLCDASFSCPPFDLGKLRSRLSSLRLTDQLGRLERAIAGRQGLAAICLRRPKAGLHTPASVIQADLASRIQEGLGSGPEIAETGLLMFDTSDSLHDEFVVVLQATWIFFLAQKKSSTPGVMKGLVDSRGLVYVAEVLYGGPLPSELATTSAMKILLNITRAYTEDLHLVCPPLVKIGATSISADTEALVMLRVVSLLFCSMRKNPVQSIEVPLQSIAEIISHVKPKKLVQWCIDVVTDAGLPIQGLVDQRQPGGTVLCIHACL